MSDAARTPPVISGLSFVRKIGEGGYADVYLYQQASPNRQVAVKVMRGVNLSEAAAAQFQDEADAMARLEHPNIVSVHWAGMTDDSRPYIVMMYYPGENLDLRVKHERLSVPEVLRIGIQIGSAVETAHRFGLLHCDIKPANILVDRYGNPGLSDFGIATKMSDADSQWGLSVPWAPPELLNGRASASARTEVYSLGATLWHLLMGHHPYQAPDSGDTPDALIKRILSTPAPALTRADVPASLDALIRMSMASNPAIRPATMLDFVHSLQDIERELHLPRTPSVVAQPDTTSDEADGPGHPEDPHTAQPGDTNVRPPKPPQPRSKKGHTTTPEGETPAMSVATQADRHRRVAHRSRLLVLLVGALVLSGIAGGGIWLGATRHPQPTPPAMPTTALQDPSAIPTTALQDPSAIPTTALQDPSAIPTAALQDPSAILSAPPGTLLSTGLDQVGVRGIGSNGESTNLFDITVVPGVTDVTYVAAYNAAYAVRADGSLWSWGKNDTHQLGRAGDPSIPAPINLENIKSVAAGEYNAYALDKNGQVWGWGQDVVSDGATVSSATPVLTGLPLMSQLVSGQQATYALTTDGQVWGWGDDGVAVTTPQAIPGFSNIKQIDSNGWGYVLGLADDSTVWLAKPSEDGSPVQAVEVDGLTNITEVAVGYGYYALQDDGTVWCWGSANNLAGAACGIDRPTLEMDTPFRLPGLTGVHRIAAIGSMAYAWTDAGLMAWGFGWMSVIVNPGADLYQPTLMPDLHNVSKVFKQESSANSFVTFFVVGSG
ncbi:MAG: protein kinase [Propionibacteriaceae bacterium]|nr:protein kinase [Propionibacteriaceae bacterium]